MVAALRESALAPACSWRPTSTGACSFRCDRACSEWLSRTSSSAIRYAGDGARLRLTVKAEGDDVVLTADDDGAGVSEEDVQRLFERFYRADRARASRGTGLGLAIVKHIVSSAGGQVQAASGPGEGLRIRIAFPP